MSKNCGTCVHWNPGSDEEGSDSHCDWEHPALPFWAFISNGDHRDYTQATDGRNCPTWVQRVEVKNET